MNMCDLTEEDGVWECTAVPVQGPPFIVGPTEVVDRSPMIRPIVAAAAEVFQHLGNGHLEAVYQKAMEHELKERGIDFQSQVYVPVLYKEHQVGVVRMDLQVRDPNGGPLVIVELKSVDRGWRPFQGQLRKYQQLIPGSVVLALNFGTQVVDVRVQ